MSVRTEIIIALVVALIAGVFSLISVWYEHQLEKESEPEKTEIVTAAEKEEMEEENEKRLSIQEITDLVVQAAQGDATAQYKFAHLYETGKSIEQNWLQAVEWYRKAAEQGLDRAQLKLARLYSKGEGVTQDFVQAAYWIRQAAEQSNAAAQYQLARLYEKGEGIKTDLTQAIHWYRQAANQGYKRAKSKLAELQSSQPQ
jgi:TPR repeat protein